MRIRFFRISNLHCIIHIRIRNGICFAVVDYKYVAATSTLMRLSERSFSRRAIYCSIENDISRPGDVDLNLFRVRRVNGAARATITAVVSYYSVPNREGHFS